MHNIKLTLAYDGTDFSGWQIQPGQPTVQGAISDVLENLTQQRLQIQGAGRTDAGGHAAGQVANFKTEGGLSGEECQRAFNALLPESIRIVAAEHVAPDFHARWNAVAKTYRYRIFRDEWSRHSSGGTCSTTLFRWILTPWLTPRENLKGSTISHRSRRPPD